MNDAFGQVVHELWRLVIPVAAFTIVVGTGLLLLVRKLEASMRRRERMARQMKALAEENEKRQESTPPD